MKQLSLIIVLLLSVLSVAGQGSADIDRRTYALYQEGKWKELTDYYRQKVDPEKVDFYYLRMRVGIAWYELENYVKAIPHFEKAQALNNTPLVKEYLYYSYLYTSQQRKAGEVYENMSDAARQKIDHPERKFFESITAEYGRNFSDAYDKNAGTDFSGEANIYGEAPFTGNTGYWYFGMQHGLGDGLSLNHGISGFNISNTMKFYIPGNAMEVPFDIRQHDYYLDLSYQFKGSSSLSVVMHAMWVDYDMPYLSYNGSAYRLETTAVELSDYLLYGQWQQRFGHLTSTLGMSFSSINNTHQQQADLTLSAWPLGNRSLVPSVKVSYYRQQESPTAQAQQEWLITPSLTATLTPKLWLSGSITFGDIYQYHENKAFVIYNNPDKISRKISATAGYSLNNKVAFNLSYRYLEREGKGLTYTGIDTSEKKLFNFTTHYIIGGIVWKL